jgi:hypothetical protein
MAYSRLVKKQIESEIAGLILQSTSLLPAIAKMSERVYLLLSAPMNSEFLLSHSMILPKIMQVLYDANNFGTLSKDTERCHSLVELLSLLKTVLKDDSPNLPLTLHIHQLFMLHIFDHLPQKQLAIAPSNFTSETYSQANYGLIFADKTVWASTKTEIVKKIFYNHLFSPTARLKTGLEGPVTNRSGIMEDMCLPYDVNTEVHKTISGVFTENPASLWFYLSKKYNMPFIGGPSGHAGSLLLLANLIGDFSTDEMKQYVTGIIGFLVGGHYHCIDEIGVVAAKAGLHYRLTHYSDLFPESLLRSQDYRLIKYKYEKPLLGSPWLTEHFDRGVRALYTLTCTSPSYFYSNGASLWSKPHISLPRIADGLPSTVMPAPMATLGLP